MKYKLITLLALLSIAGCSDVYSPETAIKDSKGGDNFLLFQSYGYCNDTICIGESVILLETTGSYEQCLVYNITTGDTVRNGLDHYNFTLDYNLGNAYSINFGNGVTETFNNNGTYVINWKCNRTYEVIICYE